MSGPMSGLLVVFVLLVSLALMKKRPKVAAALNIAAGVLMLALRVIPGNADFFDWVFVLVLLAAGGALLFVHKKED